MTSPTAKHSHRCDDCGVVVEGSELSSFGDNYIAHARSAHPDWPYSDMAIRNTVEATQRLTGSTERLETIGAVTIHPVTESRIDDWLTFFDHEAYAGNPVDAVCYCSGPHTLARGQHGGIEQQHWTRNRATMVALLRAGRAFGYLAYVDDHPAGWVNASTRAECSRYRHENGHDAVTIALSCFVIAPPYRRHGIAYALLRRVLDDAPVRGAEWVEAYPRNQVESADANNHHGLRSWFTAHGFTVVTENERDCVMRRRIVKP